MRVFKKAAAVLLTAAMTMSMGAMAFADSVTFHFYNFKGWETVGAWVYEGTAWTTNVTPADLCAVCAEEADGTIKQLWPGAKCESEGNGWFKITAEFASRDAGAVMVFNNYVADPNVTDTQRQEDVDKILASGLPTTGKEQCPNIMIGIKKDGYTAFDANEYWINWDGEAKAMIAKEDQGLLTAAPASYSAGGSQETTPAGENQTSVAGENQTTAAGENQTTAAAGGNATNPTIATSNGGSTNAGSSEKAPSTGDSVAVAVVLAGLASAGAFVAAKKKANA